MQNELKRRNLELQKQVSQLSQRLQKYEQQNLTLRIMSSKAIQQKEEEDSLFEKRIEQEITNYQHRVNLLQAENDRLKQEKEQTVRKLSILEQKEDEQRKDLQVLRMEREHLIFQVQGLQASKDRQNIDWQRELKSVQQELVQQQTYSHQLQKELIRARYQWQQSARNAQQLRAALTVMEERAQRTQAICEDYQRERERSDRDNLRVREQLERELRRLVQENEKLLRECEQLGVQAIEARRDANRQQLQRSRIDEELRDTKLKLCEFQAEARLRTRQQERMQRKRQKLGRLNLL